jgi:hypothetical protein
MTHYPLIGINLYLFSNLIKGYFMNIGQQILFCVSALGAFNGFVLSLCLFKASLMKVMAIPASLKWSWGILLGIVVLGGVIVPYQRFPGTWNNIVVYIHLPAMNDLPGRNRIFTYILPSSFICTALKLKTYCKSTKQTHPTNLKRRR